MASTYAFVTLLSSDSYLPGALTLAAALRDLHPSPPVHPHVPFHTVCLVTPETVDVSTIKLLRRAYDIVIGVELLEQQNDNALKLLGRPDLNTVLTKLHIFRLTQYSKIIFLDADVLPIRPISHLFNLPYDFSAVPDVGWPDIFNSGVLVFSPGEDKFHQLQQLLESKGSWDGGDQGILNEWRGEDWHRLSFTYNTTPTAAYTYAPAYERYGSKISAIHFIGPNKPWKSVSYRAPFTTHQPSSSDSVHQAYDYESLVDRWYSVYDKHYRSKPIVTPSSFEIKRYSSAWDQNANRTETPSITPAAPVFNLDDLRKLAIQGLNASGSSVEARDGEGEYRSMPLEGRVDLMRTRKEEPKKEEVEEVRKDDDGRNTPTSYRDPLPEGPAEWRTPPTPEPNEYPSSPYMGVVPLPRTQPHYYEESSAGDTDDDGPPYIAAPQPQHHGHSHHGSLEHRDGSPGVQHGNQHPGDHVHHHRHHGQQHNNPPQQHHHEHQESHHGQQQQQHEQHQQPQYHKEEHATHSHHGQEHHHTHHEEPRRPSSPPMLVWNPAVDPPPTDAPTPSAFPSDTYFQNVWDQPSSRQHDQTPQDRSAHTDSGGFFQPPPAVQIPEPLRREGHYANVTGHEHLGAPAPDPSKVKSVFPWEEKPRYMPNRVFPESDAPKPSLFLSQPTKPPVAPVTPESRSTPPARILSPLHGLPSSLSQTYSNAWDTVPSIQKYASKLVRPPPPPPPIIPFDSDDWRKSRNKSWDDKVEASSRDGDDEDNADDEDEDEPIASTRWDDDDEITTRRSRSGSNVSSSHSSLKGMKKVYCSRGVQTSSPAVRSLGVQVTIDPPRPEQRRKHSFSSSKRQWPSFHDIGPELSMTTAVPSPVSEIPQSTTPRNRSRKPPSPPISPSVRSPMRTSREFVVSPVLGPSRPAPKSSNSPPKTALPIVRSTSSHSQKSSSSSSKPTAPTTSPPHKPANHHHTVTSPTQNTNIAQHTSIRSPTSRPQVVSRQVSNDSLPSPVSSVGPLSPPDGQPIARRGSRVWDPARGVELFKRGSEEVLARFLKMGSWEENSRDGK